ncbi:MAG: endonuclease/exonuclease/phosphatase family protein [Labilithrix sp.]|nr:endonuclease/exonuclease/phosphatase family protein [Labilithrix sp.]MCW5810612.1 endonuclease/exonuclease/phosphatase family protein [Labilithrix sp.]
MRLPLLLFGSVGAVALTALLTTAACSSDDEPGATPAPDAALVDAPDAPMELAVETFNIGLAGAFVPNEAARRPKVIEAIGAMNADIVCLQEAWFESDKDAIEAAAKATFPHVARRLHDLDTPIEDAADETGAVPPPFTTPPCSGASVARVERGLECLAASCSTIPSSMDGRTTSTACAIESCQDRVAELVVGAPRCYGCLAPLLPTETFATIRQECTTNPKAGLGFNGASGVMILSKYPLRDVDDLVLPGTWNRRVVLRATADLPNGAAIDVHCNHLTPIFDGLSFPYTGQYGAGATTRVGWEAEQRLQASKLLTYVEQRPGIAVVLGDFNTGPEVKKGDTVTVEAEGPRTYELLTSKLTPALAAGFEPQCTYCGDNPNNNDTNKAWIDHVFLRGLGVDDVVTTERTFIEANVSADVPDAGPVLVPLSDHYGLRASLRVPPP